MSAFPRILFLDQSGALGGAELTLLDIVKDWRGQCSVLLFSDGEFRRLLDEMGAHTIDMRLPERLDAFRRESGLLSALALTPRLPPWIWRLAMLMRRYDIVVANTQKSFVLAAIAARIAGRPLIWLLEDILSAEHFSGFNRYAVVGLANLFAARVIAVSHAAAASFVAAGGLRVKLRTVPIGIDAEKFAIANPQTRQRLRHQLGIGDALLVGSFSRLSRWKGQHTLIAALARADGLHALIVGKELFGEVDYAESLRRQVQRLGLESRVHFFGFTRAVAEVLTACDIIVHTSIAPEPFGRVMIEGMLAGRPVIATAAGGALEIIENEVSGLLVTPGDSAALAAALQRLAQDADLRRRLAENGRHRARSQFSLAAMLAGVRAEIVQVAGATALLPVVPAPDLG